MSSPSVAHRVVSLPWLRPAAAPLLALTDARPDPDSLRGDPALVLHLIRYLRPTPTADTFSLDEAALHQAGPLDAAAELLTRFPHLPALDSSSPAATAGRQLAETASAIAARTGRCSPDAAWAAGLLSLLGEYGISLVPTTQGGERFGWNPSSPGERGIVSSLFPLSPRGEGDKTRQNSPADSPAAGGCPRGSPSPSGSPTSRPRRPPNSADIPDSLPF